MSSAFDWPFTIAVKLVGGLCQADAVVAPAWDKTNGAATTRFVIAFLGKVVVISYADLCAAAEQDDQWLRMDYTALRGAADRLIAASRARRNAAPYLLTIASKLTDQQVAVLSNFVRTPYGRWPETAEAHKQLEEFVPEVAALPQASKVDIATMFGITAHSSRYQ